MIMAWISVVIGYFKQVPREVYYILAAVLLLLGYGQNQYNKGKEVVLERLEQAQREAERLAREAAASADESSKERELAHAAQSATLEKVISDAQSDDRNSIDALLGSLSETD